MTHLRIPKQYDAALRLEARNVHLTVSKHMRNILREHFERELRNGHIQSSGVTNLQNLTRISKQFMVSVALSRKAHKTPMKGEKTVGLPGAQKRVDLEKLVWQGIQEAVAYSKTEDAAKDALARLLALRVANGLMRTELAILKQQDDAFVDQYLEELEGDTHELEEEAQKKS